MSPARKSLSSNAYEYRSRIPPVPSVPGAGGLGYRLQAPCLAGRGPGPVPARKTRATSSPSPRPAPARRPTRCASPPSCWPRGIVRRVTVVAPTEHLKTQWADAAGAGRASSIDPQLHQRPGPAQRRVRRRGRSPTPRWPARPLLHRARTEAAPTLVILDEVHHGGDDLSWGDAIREAFEPATRRLCLTGTPFRSDTSPIPFVTYAEGRDGIRRSSRRLHLRLRRGAARRRRAAGALPGLRRRDALAHQGRRRDRRPPRRAADQGPHRAGLAHRAGPQGRVDPGRAAPPPTSRLTEVRRGVPDAGGLVIATDQTQARAYAEILESITGEKPRRRALRRRRVARAASRTSPRATSAGWSPCGWCPRASTCPGSASGSTPPRPRRRCSSPRPSAASSGPGAAARPPRCSCPRSR